jgi:hypothetical protein
MAYTPRFEFTVGEFTIARNGLASITGISLPDSDLLGTLTVHLQDVRTVSTQAPIRLNFSDDRTVHQAVSAAEDGKIAITQEGVLAPQTCPLAYVVAINKPPVTWTGSVGAGLTL